MVANEKWFSGGSVDSDFYPYEIQTSCRFDNASTSHLYRTQGTGSSQRTWTFSTWFKKTDMFITSANQNPIFFSGSQSGGTNHGGLLFDSSKAGDMRPFNYTNSFDFDLRTSAVFRDIAGWSHVVMRVDTTQSTASNRVRLYVNGTQITDFDTESQPSQNFDTAFGINGTVMYVGDSNGSTSYDGYLAETIFTDGQSYPPTQFGETKEGHWIAKDPSGTTFGNNGFHLKYDNKGQGIFPSSLSIGGTSADSTSTGSINLFSNIGNANPPANRTQTGQGSLSYSIDLGSAKTLGAWLGQGHQSSGYATRTATGTVSYSDDNASFTSLGSTTYTFGNGVSANGLTWTPRSHRYWKIEFPSASGGDGSSGYQIGGFFLGATQSTTIADLGLDSSGNGNSFTLSGIESKNQSIDSPTFKGS